MLNTEFAQAQYTRALGDDVTLSLGVQYTDQRSVGRALPGSFETWTVGARATPELFGASVAPSLHRTGVPATTSRRRTAAGRDTA